ncbi:hypothetical protein [Nocardia bovistercoris]|uniref:Uncharacterized protein n=1 Tax=Nocardia bovistercoris TaxID=2785916 RepID=A0A931IE13_9NOCA|nr:hypothetical protein [Nocardia bovistercoris]MBH0778786.1 hypothetical protein [Nocardia bovistercoris]
MGVVVLTLCVVTRSVVSSNTDSAETSRPPTGYAERNQPMTSRRVHVFQSTTQAIGAIGSGDDIRDGDILIVPAEQVAGWLMGTTPVAVTDNNGEFDHVTEEFAFNDPTYVDMFYAATEALDDHQAN